MHFYSGPPMHFLSGVDRNGFDKYGCPEPSNSTILSGLPVIMSVFALPPPLAWRALCLSRQSADICSSRSGTSTASSLASWQQAAIVTLPKSDPGHML
jgi:hypothetical protein